MKVTQQTRGNDGDAIELLRAQHREIDQVLALLGRADLGAPTRGVVGDLADLCAVHLAVEDRVFYPSVGWTAVQDCSHIKRLVAELMAAEAERAPLARIARVLRQALLEHAVDHERRVFRLARRRFDVVRLRRLAYEMRVHEFEMRTDAVPRLAILAETPLPIEPALPT
jgi:hypothetical protein